MGTEPLVADRYRLEEQVGAGGAGVVWKATDELLHQTVALKHVSLTALSSEQAQLTRDRALREARLAAQLRGHPHVVTVYDVLVDNGDIWLVMEYLPARSLSEMLRTHGPLDPGQVARIGAHIADALAAGHARGIEHRDVKPGNVLIGDDGTVKLADYGISHLTGDPHLTQTGINGTPAFLAPEVAGNGESSPASDVFSLGSTLYAAVEGQPPFGADDNTFKLLGIVRSGIIRPPTCAGPLEPLLLRLLELTPSTRPDAAGARDLLAQLAARLTGTTEQPRTLPAPTAPTTRQWPPPRPTALVAGALIAVSAAGAIWLSTSSGNSDEEHQLSTDRQPSAMIEPSTQRPRDADPCSLLDPAALRQFGTPRLATPPFLSSCQVTIDTGADNGTHVQVIFYESGFASTFDGTPQPVGNLTSYRMGAVKVAGTDGCRNGLVLPSEQLSATITTLTYGDDTAALCAVTDVATSAAIQKYERGGIKYVANRTSAYSLAASDACNLLDSTTIGEVPDLNTSPRIPASPTGPAPGGQRTTATSSHSVSNCGSARRSTVSSTFAVHAAARAQACWTSRIC